MRELVVVATDHILSVAHGDHSLAKVHLGFTLNSLARSNGGARPVDSKLVRPLLRHSHRAPCTLDPLAGRNAIPSVLVLPAADYNIVLVARATGRLAVDVRAL